MTKPITRVQFVSVNMSTLCYNAPSCAHTAFLVSSSLVHWAHSFYGRADDEEMLDVVCVHVTFINLFFTEKTSFCDILEVYASF
jgi:hypothetical protein